MIAEVFLQDGNLDQITLEMNHYRAHGSGSFSENFISWSKVIAFFLFPILLQKTALDLILSRSHTTLSRSSI
jgi:hypothetical protein